MSPQVFAAARASACLPWATLLLAACSKPADPPRASPGSGYAAVAIGRVDVEGGLLPLSAPREGTVSTVLAREGARVRHGDALVTLDDREARLVVQGAAAELKQERAKQQLLKTQLAAAHTRTARLTKAAHESDGERQAVDDAQLAETDLASQIELSQTSIEMSQYKLQAMQYELGYRTLRAPLDAQVLRVHVQPGARVSPQSPPLVTLLPEGTPIIRADLSESYIDAVRVGMPATVTTEDDHGQSWPAHLLRVSAAEGTLSVDEEPPSRTAPRTVECVLALDAPATLRFGQRVLVRFEAAASGNH
jgi:multidrug resistance efflux pump